MKHSVQAAQVFFVRLKHSPPVLWQLNSEKKCDVQNSEVAISQIYLWKVIEEITIVDNKLRQFYLSSMIRLLIADKSFNTWAFPKSSIAKFSLTIRL